MKNVKSLLNGSTAYLGAYAGSVSAVCLALALGGAFVSTSAFAASITNLDNIDRTIVIVEGEEKKDLTLKPNETVDDFCVAPCEIGMPGDDGTFEIAEKEQIVIEDGQFFLEQGDSSSDVLDTDVPAEPSLDN